MTTIDRAKLKSEIRAALRGIADPEGRANVYAAIHARHGETVVNFSTAQSVLLFDFYRENLFPAVAPIGPDDLRYPSQYFGPDDYRRSVARFLTEGWNVEPIGYQNVFATAGAAAALECLAFAISQPLQPDQMPATVMTPAPCWQGFQYAFEQRPKLQFRPFYLKKNFELTLDDVKNAYRVNSEVDGRAPLILVLNNPQNPLGINYPRELLEEIYDWALGETGMHVISDEIYSFCQVAGAEEHPPFVSAFGLDAVRRHRGQAQDRLHVVWGLAKDFGLAGYKIGFVISRSWLVRSQMGENDNNAYHSMTSFCPFDMLKAHETAPLFLRAGVPDPALARQAIAAFSGALDEVAGCEGRGPRTWHDHEAIRKPPASRSPPGPTLLATRHDAAIWRLREGGVPLVGDGYAGLFFWLDLRKYLGKLPIPEDNTPLYVNIDPAESTLSNQIQELGGVMLLPGGVLSAPEPGYFRLCYTGFDAETTARGIDGLISALGQLHD